MRHKLWKAARRGGYDIGRDRTARLMKRLSIRGVSRSRRVRTTIAEARSGGTRIRSTRLMQVYVFCELLFAAWVDSSTPFLEIVMFTGVVLPWARSDSPRTLGTNLPRIQQPLRRAVQAQR